MKIVVNRCYGGFGLSHTAIMRYAELKGMTLYCFTIDRENNCTLITDINNENSWNTHYCICPLREDGKYNDKSYFSDRSIPRNDPCLIQVVEELEDKANGSCSRLEVVEIPDNINWEISDYDGMEHVEEIHRSW